MGGSPELPRSTVLIDPLASSVDGELLGVQQMLDQHDQLHFPSLVHPVARPVLGRVQKAELTFPVSQDVRFEIGQSTHFADRIELLYRSWAGRCCHRHCSEDRKS